MGRLRRGDRTTDDENQAEDVLDSKMPAPQPPAGKTYSGKFLVRIPPALHRKASLYDAARGESLNQFVAEALAGA